MCKRTRSVKLMILSGVVLMFGSAAAAVALAEDGGSVVGWGDNTSGQCNVPSPNSGFVAIGAGDAHTLGVKEADGSIVAWGDNEYGQCHVPAPNTGFVAVAGGGAHSLGLKADGSIVAWGYNGYGQCNVPSPNTGFAAIAAAHWQSFGVKEADGSIVAWGYNEQGQCNVPAPNEGFKGVAAGWGHTLGLLKCNGSIVAWGRSAEGQCNVPLPNQDFVAIAAGRYHSLGLKSNGSIVAWGSNTYGQCAVPSPNTGFVAIAAGVGAHGGSSLGLKADGTIVAWGRNDFGECNVPALNQDFVAIAAGERHSLGVKTGGGNQPPIAYIQSVTPEQPRVGEAVTFVGTGSDSDGDDIDEYVWTSNITPGELYRGPDSSFSTTLGVGLHLISLRVKDDRGAWSAPARTLVTVLDAEAEIITWPYDYGCGDPNPPDSLFLNEAGGAANKESGHMEAYAIAGSGWCESYSELGVEYHSDSTRDVIIGAEYCARGGKVLEGKTELWLVHCNSGLPPWWGECPCKSYCNSYQRPPPMTMIDYTPDWERYLQLLFTAVTIIIPAEEIAAILQLPEVVVLTAEQLVALAPYISDAVKLKESLATADRFWVEGPIQLHGGDNRIGVQLYAGATGLCPFTGRASRWGQLSHITIRDADGPPEGQLTVTGLCPIELKVVDPAGRRVSADHSEIPRAMREKIDLNHDGDADTYIFIPDAIGGDYQIVVTPIAGADPDKTFSLGVGFEGEAFVLAEDVPLAEIPAGPYTFHVDSVNPPLVEVEYPRGYEILSGVVTIEWYATDYEEGDDVDVSLYYSADNGTTWTAMATGLANTGAYDWDTTMISDGSYLVAVEATDAATNTRTDKSRPFVINNGDPPINHRPNTPLMPEGPVLCLVGVPYTYSTAAADSDNEALYYRFDWGGGELTGWLGPWENEEACTVARSWADAAVREVRARAMDARRQVSDWSDSLTLLIAIQATIDIDPDVLNPSSEGCWVTCYIELPAPYDVNQIDVGSVRLNSSVPAEAWPWNVGDNDLDGIPDLMVKFDRQQVLAILPPGDAVQVLITGQVGEETFGGTDTVRVLAP